MSTTDIGVQYRSKSRVGLALAFALDCGWDVWQWQVPKAWGNSSENLFKNAKGRPLLSYFSNVTYCFKVQVCYEAVHMSP